MARNWVWHSRHASRSTFSFWSVTSAPVEGTKSLTRLMGVNGLPLAYRRMTRRCTFEGSYAVPAAAGPAVITFANWYEYVPSPWSVSPVVAVSVLALL